MKIARVIATVMLLLFVGATVGVLIAQGVSQPSNPEQSDVMGVPLSQAEDATSSAPIFETSTPSEDLPDDADAPSDVVVDGDVVAAQSVSDEDEAPVETVDAVAEDGQQEACVVDAIYFHNTRRCYTCEKIEETAKAIMEAEFADEFASGKLRWSAINMEEEREYIQQYDLAMPTLILSRRVNDAAQDWIALGDTWRLVGSETRFSMYVIDRTRTFLGGCE